MLDQKSQTLQLPAKMLDRSGSTRYVLQGFHVVHWWLVSIPLESLWLGAVNQTIDVDQRKLHFYPYEDINFNLSRNEQAAKVVLPGELNYWLEF